MLLWVLRGAFVVLMFGLALVAFETNYRESLWIGVANVFLVILVTGGVIIADMMIRDKQITTISAVYFGLLLGMLLGSMLSVALDPFFEYWLPSSTPGATGYMVGKNVLRLMLGVICCYVTISTLLQTKDEFRFIIPYVEFSKQVKGGKPLVLDTSVIIDGRIADMCDTRIDRHQADRAAVRAAGTAGDRRQLGQAEAEPRPARAGHPQADADQPEDRAADARRRTCRSCAKSTGWTSGWWSSPRCSAAGW